MRIGTQQACPKEPIATAAEALTQSAALVADASLTRRIDAERSVTNGSSRDARAFAPVIVMSVARSCSSVISTMLGQHPSLYGFPELTLFSARTVGDALRNRYDLPPDVHAWTTSGIHRSLAEVMFGGQDDAAIAAARKWLDERRDLESVELFDLLQSLVAPRIAVEKSPETTDADAFIFRAIVRYPRARFIHLVRHPVATIDSMRRYWQNWPWMRKHAPLEVTSASIWYASHCRIAQILDEYAPDRTLRVRAEDVLGTGGPRELGRIASWLGLRADPLAVDSMMHPERSPFATVGPEGAAGGNDGGFLARPEVRVVELPSTFAFPEAWGLSPQQQGLIVELAQKLGY